MKRITNILTGLALMAFAAISCSKSGVELHKTVDQVLVGEWHLVDIKTDDEGNEEVADVYLAISPYGRFELYQKTGSQEVRYDRYSGECWTENGILSGVYIDGTPWGSKYIYATIQDGFILKSYNLIEEQRYIKVEIPEDVRTNANNVCTKSAASGSPIL